MDSIVFSSNTGATRVFNSYNLAQERFHGYEPITRPSDFLRFKDVTVCYEQMVKWAKSRGEKVTPRETDDLSEDDIAKLCFDLAFKIGDRVKGDGVQNPTKSGYVVNLEAAKKLHADWESDRVCPKQAAMIADFLVSEQYDFYTKQEMQRAVCTLNCIRRLKTKQDPWRIFRYYKPVLLQHGVISEAA